MESSCNIFVVAWCFLLFLIHAILLMSSTVESITTTTKESPNATDALALLAFKQRNDPFNSLSTWNDSVPFCQWQGITCSRRHPLRVVAMNVTGLQLEGPLSPFIANLTFLRAIDLSNNKLIGQIPAEIGRLFRLRPKKKHPEPHLVMNPLEDQLLQISYGDLSRATNGFSQANLIGVGSYGSVYKGSLDRIGKIVAVKVLNLERRGASNSFIAECRALRNIRHRNLLKIHTVCSSIDSKGNDFKAMVFDYMANGNLEQWLHPSMDEQNQSKNLTLIQRLNIAVDVASALNYLHNSCEKSIVHCDLKPSNILLDDDMNAHVGDFGLARFLFEATSSCSQNHTNSPGIKGTIGYLAPEYGMGGEASTFGDIYSYGILLLEMFTGKKPTDEIFNGSLSLHQFAKMALPERVRQIVDQRLLSVEAEALNERIHIWELESMRGITEGYIGKRCHWIEVMMCDARKRGFSIALVLLDLVNVIKQINRVEDWSLKTHVSDIDELVSSFSKISFMHVAIGLLMVLLFGLQL
ncbi:hypothetical protein AAC387_Pa07g1068 [Persea americana]